MLKRNKRGGRPSPYPRYLFHGLRSMQLLSSIVVGGIMSYFSYHLHREGYQLPWTFIVLFSVSLATIAALSITIFAYNFTYLSPRFNIFLNGGISILWVMGFAMLSSSVSSTHVLDKQCTGKIWGGDTEASVCRDYKALWAMAFIGTFSTLAALLLDAHTYRKTNRQGKYLLPEDDKDAQRLNSVKSARVRSEGYDAPSEHNAPGGNVFEQDIAYHNRYGMDDAEGQEVLISGPLEDEEDNKPRDMGYHNQFFHD